MDSLSLICEISEFIVLDVFNKLYTKSKYFSCRIYDL